MWHDTEGWSHLVLTYWYEFNKIKVYQIKPNGATSSAALVIRPGLLRLIQSVDLLPRTSLSRPRILDPGGRIALQRVIVNEENVWEMKNMHALVWNRVMLTKLVFRAMAWMMLYLVLHGGPQGFPYMFGSVQTYCRSIGMVVQAIQEQKDPKGSPNILQRPPKPADQGKIYVTILLKRQGQTMTEAR